MLGPQLRRICAAMDRLHIPRLNPQAIPLYKTGQFCVENKRREDHSRHDRRKAHRLVWIRESFLLPALVPSILRVQDSKRINGIRVRIRRLPHFPRTQKLEASRGPARGKHLDGNLRFRIHSPPGGLVSLFQASDSAENHFPLSQPDRRAPTGWIPCVDFRNPRHKKAGDSRHLLGW